MSANDKFRLDGVGNLKELLDQWAESLAQVMESMTDQRPGVEWKAASGPLGEIAAAAGAGPEADILWWEQPFQISPGMLAWVGAPRTAWEYAGTLTLKAAGLEIVESGEARNTWFEILGQSLSAMARSIGGMLGREVTCEAGVERKPDPEMREWATVALKFADAAPAILLVAISGKLASVLAAPAASPEGEKREKAPSEPRTPSDSPQGMAVPRSRTMELLLDVDLPVSVSFGKAQMPLRDVLKLTTGSIVELNRGVTEQVEVLVNQSLIARGEVVVVDGNYGVRIQQIVSRQERLRSLK